MVLTNMFLVLALMVGKGLQTIFFGRLRAIEVDHLYERAWYAVTETCLAMTIFREEFDTRFFLFFTLLLAVKIFHWLAQDRVEYMEQTVEVSRGFHMRMTSIIVLLLALDTYLVQDCLEKILVRGPNVMIMFAFEFTILASTILGVAGKYTLNLIEARQAETWDNKSLYTFYLELGTDFIRLVTYVAFFITILTCYGLPLHIVRDLYVTLRSFTTKCRNFMRFRKATEDMDRRYPNATPEELEATGDKTCIVCREDMLHASHEVQPGDATSGPLDNPKKLPCGHILHFRCLRSWLERQQSCPMCRRPVIDENAERPQQPAPRPQVPNAAPPTISANNARFQMPQEAAAPIQLPRDFRLPPGWALLPVTTNEVPAAPTAANNSPRPLQSIPGVQLPPVIPLSQATTSEAVIPTLSDEQIQQMVSSTRRTIEERLRILREIQNRVTEGVEMLTRLQTIPILPEPVDSDTPVNEAPTT